jgi:hypothetical protein
MEDPMSVAGQWTLHYSWGATNNYAQSVVSFNGNGTFGGTLNGKWWQQDGTLLLSFDTGPAKYGGTVDGSVGSGAMSTFAGLNGSWYLTREGVVGMAPAAPSGKQSHDPAGNRA